MPIEKSLRPLVEFAAHHPHAQDINAQLERWDTFEIIKPYGHYYAGLLFADVPTPVYARATEDFLRIHSSIRYSILGAALQDASDEQLSKSRRKILPLVTETAEEQVAGEIPPSTILRGEFDRLLTLQRLSRLGIVDRPVVDQDVMLAQILDTENGFSVTLNDLLQLEECFSATGSNRQALAETFRAWRDDPEAGGQVLREEGLVMRLGDMAIGYDNSKKLEGVTVEQAQAKVDHLLSIKATESVVAYVEELLFAKSQSAVAIYENLCQRGYKGLLVEGSGQILKAYGLALARQSRIKEARAVAVDGLGYEDYASIHLEISRNLRARGDRKGALANLDALRQIDPVLNFPQVDEDAYAGMMGGSPLGFMNEFIAEEYARCGAYQQTLETFKNSRQYPDQTTRRIAAIVLESGDVSQYLEAVFGLEADQHDTIFMVSDLTVHMLQAMRNKVSLGGSFAKEYPAVSGAVRPFMQKLYTIHGERSGDSLVTGVITKNLIRMATSIGAYDEAIRLLTGDYMSKTPLPDMQMFGAILTDMAKTGQYKKAAQLLDEHGAAFQGLGGFDFAQLNIVVMGWALTAGDKAMFRKFYHMLPDYKRQTALHGMLGMFSQRDLKLDRGVVELIVKGEDRYASVQKAAVVIGRLLSARSPLEHVDRYVLGQHD